MGEVLRPRLAFAFNQPFIRCDFLQGHRAAGTKLLRGDANLCAEAELCTVGEAGRSIPVNAGSVDMGLELAGSLNILCDDGLAVAGTMLVNMCQGLIERTYSHNIHLIVHELRIVVSLIVEEKLNLSLHRSQQSSKVCLPVLVDEQRIECVTD